MSTQKTLLTADEFYLFCCENEGRYELVDGEVVPMAPVNEEHGGISLNIGVAFHGYSRQSGAGRAGVEIGYRLLSNPDTVRGPDVSFALPPRSAGEVQRTGFVPGAPDIAVEVVSPSNTAADMERKVREYLEAGSLRVWAVYPLSRSVVVYQPNGATLTYTGDDVITDEELLPGFSLPLAEIFE